MRCVCACVCSVCGGGVGRGNKHDMYFHCCVMCTCRRRVLCVQCVPLYLVWQTISCGESQNFPLCVYVCMCARACDYPAMCKYCALLSYHSVHHHYWAEGRQPI